MSFFESLLLLVVLEWNFMGLAILSKFSLLATFLARGEEKKKISFTGLVLECERWNTRGHQMSIDSQEEGCC